MRPDSLSELQPGRAVGSGSRFPAMTRVVLCRGHELSAFQRAIKCGVHVGLTFAAGARRVFPFCEKAKRASPARVDRQRRWRLTGPDGAATLSARMALSVGVLTVACRSAGPFRTLGSPPRVGDSRASLDALRELSRRGMSPPLSD